MSLTLDEKWFQEFEQAYKWKICHFFMLTLRVTYIPMVKGFVYLTAVMDWASCRVLAAKVAIKLEACHAVDVLQEAFNRMLPTVELAA
ncbi:MAG TPA: hypothetical protein VIQ51_06860 [Chryseosolibacter sp.]